MPRVPADLAWVSVSRERLSSHGAGRNDAASSEACFAAESHEAIVSAMRDAAAGGHMA